MARVKVSVDLLNWAIRRSGRPIDELTQICPELPKWLRGDVPPTFKQLENFAAKTYTPFGYFFLPAPPVESLPVPYYRTLETNEKVDDVIDVSLADTVQQMFLRQEWMKDYLVTQGAEPLDYIRAANQSETAVTVARKIRAVLGLEENWASKHSNWTEALGFLKERIENIGVLLVVNGILGNNTHRKLDPNVFRGFVLVDEYAPLLFVNGADGKAAQMFTLAHELAHLFLGQSAAFNLRSFLPADNPLEQQCDQIAAEFLVPATLFNTAWDAEKMAKGKFQKLAKKFKVSEIVIARRALDLNKIDKTAFFEFYNEYCSRDHGSKSAASGGNFYATQFSRVGKRFGASVVAAARDGYLLYSDAYRLTGLYGKTFNEFADRLGLGVL